MNQEKYTPQEVANLEKSRAISDAQLLKDGAEYVINDKGEKELKATISEKRTIAGAKDYTEEDGEAVAVKKIQNRLKELETKLTTEKYPHKGWSYRGGIVVDVASGMSRFGKLATAEIIKERGHYYLDLGEYYSTRREDGSDGIAKRPSIDVKDVVKIDLSPQED
jgi:hypothetical protein